MSRGPKVVVVGGGSIGCAVSYYAARRGLSVTLIDKPKRGRATSASAGGTWPLGESLGLGCGIIYYKALLKQGALPRGMMGPEQLPDFFLDFAMQSNSMFPDLARELKEVGGLDIEFERTGLIFVMLDEADATFAHMLMEKFPRDKSLLRWISREELNRDEPAVCADNHGGLRFLSDDQVNPYRFADALRAAARRCGAVTVTHTEVTGLRMEGNRVSAVETTNGVFPCDVVVNAAGSWARDIGRMAGLDIPVYPVRGQIVGTEALPEILHACISTSDCYVAQKLHGEIIVGSTTEEVGYDTTVTADAIRQLSTSAIRVLPLLEEVRIKRVWCGLRPGTRDELPILGPVDGVEGYYNACGHFRTGILNAPFTAKLICEMLLGEPLSFDCKPFLLSRFLKDPALKLAHKVEARVPTMPETSVVGSVGYSIRRHDGLGDFANILGQAVRITPRAGEAIIREGDVGDAFYVVTRGGVRVEREGRLLARLGAGDFVGEIALLENRPRTATVYAEADTELMVIPKEDFFKLLAERPEVGSTIMHVMAQRQLFTH